MRWFPVWLVAGFIALSVLSVPQVKSQVPMTGAGKGAPGGGGGSSYVGPGDVAGWSTMAMWGSCARVFSNAKASTSTALCDLYPAAGGSLVGTLRGTTSGQVDLSAYFTGSVTPTTACSNVTSCVVGKVYDQTGNGNFWTQTSPNTSNAPAITFSYLNSLPCITYSDGLGTPTWLTTTTTPNLPQPLTFTHVLNHAAPTTNAANAIMGDGSSVNYFDGTLGTNTFVTFAGGSNGTVAVTDNANHAIQAVWDDANGLSAVYHDGTNTAYAGGPIGTTALGQGSLTIALGSNGGAGSFSFNGTICEIGVNSFSANSTQKSNMNSNQHGTNGYNF